MTLQLLLVSVALATEADTTPTFGMAGAGSANPNDLGAIRRAPAAMLLSSAYTSQADIGFGGGEGFRLMGGVRDTRTSGLGMGVLTTHHWATRDIPDAQMPGWVTPGEVITDTTLEASYRVSLGYGFIPQTVQTQTSSRDIRRFALGASVAYERWNGSWKGLVHGWGVDASAAGRPTQNMVLSATAKDLLTPLGLRDPSLDLGWWWNPAPWVTLALDGGWDPNVTGPPIVSHGGLELVAMDALALRGGYGLEGRRQVLGAGLGVLAEDAARLDYGIQIDLAGPDEDLIRHSIGLYASF
jgi:hypothetical protein